MFGKAERFTDDSQLTLGVLGLLLTPDAPEVAPEASPASSTFRRHFVRSICAPVLPVYLLL